MDPAALGSWAMWSGIARDLVTVLSLAFAVWSYRRNARAQLQNAQAQVELAALGALQHYLDLAVEHPDLASHDPGQPIDARYGWFAAQALTTAQTLHALVGTRANWQRGIEGIVRQHRAYLCSDAFVGDDFAPEFVRYLQSRVPDMRRSPAVERAD